MSVKPLLRLVLVTGAAGVILAFAHGASADVVDPARPYQPVMKQTNPAPAFPVVRMPTSHDDLTTKAPAEQPDSQAPGSNVPIVATDATPAPADPVVTPRPAPAPESVVTRPAPRAKRAEEVTAPAATTTGLVATDSASKTVMQHVRSFLAELASTCKVGASAGSGGPVLVLAVLGMVAALNRRRVFRTRLATDEETPDFLFAWDVISPG